MGFVNSSHGTWKSTLRNYDPTRWQIKEDVENMNYRDFNVNAMRKDAAANDMTNYFSHHFSTKLAFLFYKIGVSPNFVTWFSISNFSPCSLKLLSFILVNIVTPTNNGFSFIDSSIAFFAESIISVPPVT